MGYNFSITLRKKEQCPLLLNGCKTAVHPMERKKLTCNKHDILHTLNSGEDLISEGKSLHIVDLTLLYFDQHRLQVLARFPHCICTIPDLPLSTLELEKSILLALYGQVRFMLFLDEDRVQNP